MKIKIYYHHTDCGGVVYYANYLNFLEEARTEFLEKKGVSIKKLRAEGTQFVVYRQEIEYKSPAFYADTLEINTALVKISAAKLEFEYIMKNQNKQIVCTAKTIMACLGLHFKPKPIPTEIIKKLSFDKVDESKSVE